MIHVSLTRLRIRSVRFLPLFFVHILRTNRQIKRAPGFQHGGLLADRRWTFWTLTAWDSKESMRAYMTTGSHKQAMPHLLHWCDEASVAHWTQADATLPSWPEADRLMRDTGRASKVLHPSPQHASLTFSPPRTTGAGKIRPV
jgi:heme-degrading monooxygenase HmoA